MCVPNCKIKAETLGDEERRVLSRYRTRFRRAGADLGPQDKLRVAEIAARMSELGTQFSQNLLADESGFLLPLDAEDDRAGLPDFLLASTADAAKAVLGERVAPYDVGLDAARLDAAIDMVVRLVLSHVMQPSGSPGGTADDIAWIAARVLR